MSILYFLLCKYGKSSVDQNLMGILALIDILIIMIIGVATLNIFK